MLGIGCNPKGPAPAGYNRRMQVDVAIVGAGLVGASIARALAGSRLSLALLETAAPPARSQDWETRVYAVSPGNAAYLDSLGAWHRISGERTCAVRAMRIFGDDARSRLEFSAYEAGASELAWIVESGELARALWSELGRQANLELVCPAGLRGLVIGEDSVALTTDSGRTLDARLVVGADGANSWVRSAAGFEVASQGYGQKGVVANFRCERPHHGVAQQWFRADGILAWLPLPGDRVSIVWSTADDHADELVSLPEPEFCARVLQAGASSLGAMKLVTSPVAFPLTRLTLRKIVRPRVALIGDAAHVVHPLAGQGVNLGFGDARALAAVLEHNSPGDDPGEYRLLRRFERARAEDILAMRLLTDGLQRLFGSQSSSIARLRNLGLNLTDSLPVLKGMLARRAMV